MEILTQSQQPGIYINILNPNPSNTTEKIRFSNSIVEAMTVKAMVVKKMTENR